MTDLEIARGAYLDAAQVLLQARQHLDVACKAEQAAGRALHRLMVAELLEALQTRPTWTCAPLLDRGVIADAAPKRSLWFRPKEDYWELGIGKPGHWSWRFSPNQPRFATVARMLEHCDQLLAGRGT
jgi:hypothetical protein